MRISRRYGDMDIVDITNAALALLRLPGHWISAYGEEGLRRTILIGPPA
jgi:hypothetical protein